MTKAELDLVVDEHCKWLLDDSTGRRANLSGADLRTADLGGANLSGATGLRYQIPQDGTLTAYKKAGGKIVRLEIPADAKRTASVVGRKCRCERAIVLWIQGDTQTVTSTRGFVYTVGQMAEPDSYDPDPRVECSHGIHFFQTREEAEEYQEGGPSWHTGTR